MHCYGRQFRDTAFITLLTPPPRQGENALMVIFYVPSVSDHHVSSSLVVSDEMQTFLRSPHPIVCYSLVFT